MTVKTETFVSTKIAARNKFGWAILSWDEQGLVTLTSDHGQWTYYWTAIGSLTMPAFLAKIDRDYAGGKFLSSKEYRVADVEATVEAAKRQILELRREGEISEATARMEWNEVKLIGSDNSITTYIHNSSIPEVYECCRTMENPRWVRFWEKLWAAELRPELKRLAAEEG